MTIETKIKFTRFDRDFHVLEEREQKCKSWVKQLWELLYVSAAGIAPETPRAGVIDAMGMSRSIDKIATAADIADTINGQPDHHLESTLLLTAPAGRVGQYIATMASSRANAGSRSPQTHQIDYLLGEQLGICVGTGNTAVAPNDHMLVEKLGHGINPANAVETLYYGYDAGDASDSEVYGTRYAAVYFIPFRAITATKVQLKLYREGALGDVVMHLGGIAPNTGSTTGVCLPDIANDIASVTVNLAALTTVSPGIMVDFTFATPVELLAGGRYVIWLSKAGGDATNNVHWRYQTGLANYVQSIMMTSTDGGVNWLDTGNGKSSFVFGVYGTTRTEVEYGGCEIHNLSVANPNASFQISRLFYNNSGVAVTLNECGIYAAGKRIGSAPISQAAPFNSIALPFCVARDVIGGGIVFNDGEVLQVTYTPAVTV